jgi:hypothetical protein
MIEGLLTIHYLALALAGTMGLLWILLEATEKKPLRPMEKARIFACGIKESPEMLNVPEHSYYNYLLMLLRTEALANLHSGKLSSYVTWILMGMALILSVMLILW